MEKQACEHRLNAFKKSVSFIELYTKNMFTDVIYKRLIACLSSLKSVADGSAQFHLPCSK